MTIRAEFIKIKCKYFLMCCGHGSEDSFVSGQGREEQMTIRAEINESKQLLLNTELTIIIHLVTTMLLWSQLPDTSVFTFKKCGHWSPMGLSTKSSARHQPPSPAIIPASGRHNSVCDVIVSKWLLQLRQFQNNLNFHNNFSDVLKIDECGIKMMTRY